jgi:hypothetical protein
VGGGGELIVSDCDKEGGATRLCHVIEAKFQRLVVKHRNLVLKAVFFINILSF